MDSNAVAVSALGVPATSVGLMAWVVKKVLNDVAPALIKHSNTAEGLQVAVEKNTESNVAMITFMTKLNGKLPALVEEKKKQAATDETLTIIRR